MNLIDQRPDLFLARIEEAIEAEANAPEHVKEDPLGWLIDQAAGLGNYIIREEGKPDQLNTLLSVEYVKAAIMIMRVGAVALARANPSLMKPTKPEEPSPH